MSLLLDALKKAADDKQKASQDALAVSAPQPSDKLESDSVSNTVIEVADNSKNRAVEPQPDLQTAGDEQTRSEDTEELTLEVLDSETAEPVENISQADELNIEDIDEPDVEPLTVQQTNNAKKSETTSYTVSDEALSMLINKTNRDVKHGRRIMIFGMLAFSLIVLISGGVYYYMDMQAEITNLERKHQIAMQSMRSKTSKEKAPEKSKIIHSLVSESGLDDKVQYAKKQMADEKNSQQVQHRPAAINTGKVKTGTAPSVSFQKTNKADPVAEKLDEAWMAYDDGQYGHAKNIYDEVLNIEADNRDALLGLGAIAVIEKDYLVARDIYLSLLKQDPRDPMAIAALASLQNNDVTLETDEKFLLNMLQKNPDAPHLNFALGNIYAQQEKWKSAQQSYFNAWQHDVENADYIFNLAVSMDQLGKQQQAVVFYKDSLSKSKNKQVGFSREAVQKRITELSEL